MLGSWEWLLILLIVLLLFGVGRISQVFAELGKGIRAFREGLQGDEHEATGSSSSGAQQDPNEPASPSRESSA